MKKGVGYLLIAMLIVCLGLVFAPKASSQTQDVKILSYTDYMDSSGFLNVVGEVQNQGSTMVNNTFITGVAYVNTAQYGVEASPSYCEVWQSFLAPEQKAPFIMEFEAPDNLESWSLSSIENITMTLTCNATDSYQYSDFKVTSSQGGLGTGDYNGIYEVNGVIENTGAQTGYNLTLAATFYNSTGSVVAVGTTYETDDPWITPALLPGATVNFQVYPSDFNETGGPSWEKISSYSLIVQTTGPILQGIPPAADNAQGTGPSSSSSSGSTGTSTSTATSGNSKNTSSSSKISFVVIAVVIIVVAAIAVLLMRRGSKPRQAPKKAQKSQKPKSTVKR